MNNKYTTVYQLFVLDRNTWYQKIVRKLFVLKTTAQKM